MKHHLALGKTGEGIAARYLQKRGYIILAKNWRYRKAEIDLIAGYRGILIFCEVKTRSNTLYGQPEAFVNPKKQKLLVDAAIMYMQDQEYTGEFRFDIIAIIMKNPEEYALKHFEDAFFPGLEGFM